MPGAPVVFLQHGITDSAEGWIMNYKNKSVAFELAMAGYDVWLGNQRGTKFSMGHKTLSTKSKKYWEFSWTEMGDYDAPAQVEYVLKTTGVKNASWIGHSEGTTQMFYSLSKYPEYWADKLNLFVSLAPVTAISHSTSEFLQYISKAEKQILGVANFLGIYEILGPFTADAFSKICYPLPYFCKLMEGYVLTENPKYDDSDRFTVSMGHLPSGASTQSIAHYGQ
jgi:pimeloyl-ACP methyl ester carboxylesterase